MGRRAVNRGVFGFPTGKGDGIGDLVSLTNSLSGNVALSVTPAFFDGPSVAQGSSGTWFASGTVTVKDTTGPSVIVAKLWDGTTVVASCVASITATGQYASISLSGVFVKPAGNIRISVNNLTTTSGSIKSNDSGAGNDSTITAIQIA